MFQPYFEATPGLIVAEEDVKRLIMREQATRRLNVPKITRFYQAGVTVLMLLVLSYVLINAPALFIKTEYTLQTEVLPAKPDVQAPPALPIPGAAVAQPVQKVETTATNLEDNHLYINRIKVNAPINWDVNPSDDDVLNSLKTGVAHLKGNAHPGEKGNVFMVGHSSNYIWAKGDYKQVFVLLPDLKVGDLITVVYHNVPYEYRVSDLQTVAPDDVSVLRNGDEAELKLMTCVPIGTKSKRFIAIAKPTNPALHTAHVALPSTDGAGTLPGAR